MLEGKTTTISRHKAITHALDPEDNLFGILQRFITFRGYLTVDTMGGGSMSKPKLCPNAIKDSLTSACKTDVDHTLGYYFDSCFVLHRCHHAVNQWLHQMRLSAGHWGNPYHNLAYTEDVDTHRRPNFLQRLPPTLKPRESKTGSWNEAATKILIDAYDRDNGDSHGLFSRLAKVEGLGGFSEPRIRSKVSHLIGIGRLAWKP